MMTTFQIILAAAGVLLIVGVLVYNIIQERRFRKEADRLFNYKQEDILLGESVHTPGEERPGLRADVLEREIAPLDSLDIPGLDKLDEVLASADTVVLPPRAEPSPAEPAQAEAVRRVAPSSEPARPAPEAPRSAPAPLPDVQPDHPSPLDADTEYIVRLRLAPGASLAGLMTALRRVGKPVRAFGYRAGGDWEAIPLTGGRSAAWALVEIGLQLVDRGGAVGADQIDAYCRALYGYTAEEGGAVSCPDKAPALRAAKDLDLFCMDVDVLIGLNVVSGDARPFMGEAIHQVARDAGLTLEGGAYQARNDAGRSLFTVTNQDEEPFPAEGRGLTTHGVTLLFDVPRVADGLAVFDRMTRFGYDLAARLDGRLVDDNGRQVTEDSLHKDRARLQDYFDRMARRGIPAGGEQALRLFV